MKHLQKTILILTCFLTLHLNVLATLVTHEWQNNHRGYSIELIPGTDANVNSSPEYVAAGTVYDANRPYPGWHFMHLDATGAIIDERTSWATSGDMHEFRVVDIVAESATKFWITIQARSVIPGFERDYIYIAGVTEAGVDLTINPAIYITRNDCDHQNLYPTHSFFAEGEIYICGYAAQGSQYPNQPDKYLTSKYGMLLKCDVNATPATTSFKFWNSASNFPYDYDMALRIAPYGYGSTFPLLLTGATGDGYYSSVLVGKFDNNLNSVGLKGLHPLYAIFDDSPAFGSYGVDIRGGVYGGSGADPEGDPLNKPDVIVLFNSFNEDYPNQKSWGLLRVRNDLQSYPGVNSMVTISETSWATQFLQMHGSSPTDQTRSENHIGILGGQYDFITGGSEPCIDFSGMGALNPSLVNVNPFAAMYGFGYSNWNYGTGFSTLPIGPFISHKVYASSQGTEAVNMDYYQGSLGAGSILEDVTRLYTFGSLVRYYDNPATPNQYPGKIGMIAPIGESPASTPSNNNLLTKFIGLNSLQQETSCDKYGDECNALRYYIDVYEYDIESETENLISGDAYSLFILDNLTEDPSVHDCTQSYFKPGKTAGIINKEPNNNISIYPNPATNELNIDFTNVTGKYEFVLKDVTGKVVVENSGVGGNAVKVSLPVLSTGVYIATVRANQIVHTEKVVIK